MESNSLESITESDSLKTTQILDIDNTIATLENEQATINKRLEELKLLKNNISEYTIDRQLVVNDNELSYSVDNKKYLDDKITRLTTELAEARKSLDEQSRKESLLEAAKFLSVK